MSSKGKMAVSRRTADWLVRVGVATGWEEIDPAPGGTYPRFAVALATGGRQVLTRHLLEVFALGVRHGRRVPRDDARAD